MSQTQVKQALGTGVVIEAVQSLTGAESIAPDHMGRSRESAVGYIPQSVNVEPALLRDVQVLLTQQAAMLDARRWNQWMELFTDDGVYWMPAAPEQTDWASQPSIFAEDRLLMEVRANRLLHPNAWSQAPMWETDHLVSHVAIESVGEGPEGHEIRVRSKFHMMELRRDTIRHFGGRYRHTLVRGTDGALRIKLQRVDLFNAQAPFDYVLQIWV